MLVDDSDSSSLLELPLSCPKTGKDDQSVQFLSQVFCSQVHALGSAGSAIVRSFDILAVEPTNEKCFQQACTSMGKATSENQTFVLTGCCRCGYYIL